jgi:acetyl esterase/lipase
VLGFSAGGHLASTLATHHQRFVSPEDDLASSQDARPDAAVLCYPVIDMGEFAHVMSRNRLLGPDPDPALLTLLSNHLQVTADTPPTFLWHTADDAGVPMEGSLFFAAACRKHKVPVELHVFESGKHGLGLADGQPAGAWKDFCVEFLRRHLVKN